MHYWSQLTVLLPVCGIPDKMPTRESITAVILAGGRATRMGGQDKGLLRYLDKTFVEHIAGSLVSDVAEVVINANRNLDIYSGTGFQVISDALDDYQGPLAGMYSTLLEVDTDWIITAPCDGPFVARDYVSRMSDAVVQSSEKLAVASDGEWLQPVYALVHKDLCENLMDFLDGGERKIDRWYRQVGFSEVVFSEAEDRKMFTNVNTPEQLASLTG